MCRAQRSRMVRRRTLQWLTQQGGVQPWQKGRDSNEDRLKREQVGLLMDWVCSVPEV